MKNKYTLLIILSVIFISCGEDRRKEYAYRTEPNEWIEEVMRDIYYWNEQISESKNLNYYASPENFFNSLLNSADGKNSIRFSKIIDTREEESEVLGIYKKSYGFYYDENTFTPINSTTRTQYALRVTYVIEDTPADRGGLKRGDWIVQLNNSSLNQSNIKNTFGSCDSILNITLGEYDSEGDSITVTEKKLTVGVGEYVVEKPVQLSKILTTNDSRKVGYLLYNHFSSGIHDGTEEYLEDLVQVSRDFKAADISELVLDFRFNPGGTLTAAQLLSAMIIPREHLGAIMTQVEYNNNHSEDNYNIYFNLRGAENLNLNRVYFITSKITASAAELVINSVKPYVDEVITIGLTTLGEDVGITKVTDEQERYPWIIYPVVCKFYNSRNEEFNTGISPTATFQISEKDSTIMRELGTKEELLLKRAFDNIEGNDIIGDDEEEEEEPETRAKKSKISHPLIRKKFPGILMK